MKLKKDERELAEKIAKKHYVPLDSKKRQEAGMSLDDKGLVRLYEDQDGNIWAKAKTRFAYDQLKEAVSSED